MPSAFLAQLGERQTEDLKVSCSIHEESISFAHIFYFFVGGHFLFDSYCFFGVLLCLPFHFFLVAQIPLEVYSTFLFHTPDFHT